MIYLALGIFIASALLLLLLKKDVLYPGVCVNLVFSIVLLGYVFTSYIYIYKLSDDTLLFILFNVLTFTVSAVLSESILSSNLGNKQRIMPEVHTDKVYMFGWLLIFFCSIYILMRLSNYHLGSDFLQYMSVMRETDVEDTSRNLSSYFQPIILSVFAIYIWVRKNTYEKNNRIFTLAVFLVFSFAIILNTGKQIVFMAIISYAYIAGIRKVKHYIYLSIAILIFFSSYMLFLRGLSGSLDYYMSMYLVSPVIAFQEYYYNQISILSSSHVFWFFERLWGLVSTSSSMSLHKEFVWVGLPTNVYTAFSDYVYITPEFSYVMMVFHGAFSGLLWQLSRHYMGVKIFYSYFIYTFAFMFYHESFMTNISSWIQIALSIVIFSQLLKIKRKK